MLPFHPPTRFREAPGPGSQEDFGAGRPRTGPFVRVGPAVSREGRRERRCRPRILLRPRRSEPPPRSLLPAPSSRLGRAGSGRAAVGRGRILRWHRALCPAPPGSPRVRGTAGGTAAPGQPPPQQRRDERRGAGGARAPGMRRSVPMGGSALSLGWEGLRASSAGRHHPGWILGWAAPTPSGGGRGSGGCGPAGGAHPPTAPGRVRVGARLAPGSR